jgi:hypothetical protein
MPLPWGPVDEESGEASLTPRGTYNAACVRAVTTAALRAADRSPAGAQQADAEGDRALAWLERAVAAGFRDAATMAQDHDLGALRHPDDFK